MSKWLTNTINPKVDLATPVEWRKKCFMLAYERMGKIRPTNLSEFADFMQYYIDELIGPDIRKMYDVDNLTDKDVVAIFMSLMEYACGEYI